MSTHVMHNQTVAVLQLRAALGEAIDDDMQLLLDMIEGETGFLEAVDAVLEARADNTAMIEAMAQREAELRARRQRFEMREETIRKALQRSLEATGLKKLQRPLATLSLGNRAPMAIVTNEALIPDSYKIPQPAKLDRRMLLEALRGGVNVPGAALSNGGTSLTIRSK